MNGVLGMARALNRSRLGVRQREQVEMMIRSGEGLMTILNDFLDLSKIEAGKFELEAVAFDVHALALEIGQLWSDAAEAKDVKLDVEIGPSVPQLVEGDPTRLRQILTNLVSNALKFTTGASARVALLPVHRGRDGDGGVRRVRHRNRHDLRTAGAGVRALHPGRRGHRAPVRRHGPGPVHLPPVRRDDGGEITAQSTPGVGSTFSFRLSLPIAEQTAADRGRRRPGRPGGPARAGRRDNPINQAVAQSIVGGGGRQRHTAVGDGAAALGALRTGDFDVVLMDVHMPVMDGLEAIRRIRAGEAGRADQPVLALTADAMPGVDSGLMAHGFDAVATKPIVPQALIEAMAAACRPRPDAGAEAAA
jgi:CheY-like chemotaxis protein